MHAQSSICSLLTCQNLIGSILSILILKEYQGIQQKLIYINPNNATQATDTSIVTIETYSSFYWISSIVSLVMACCIGAAVVAIARSMLSSRSQGGLKFFCVFEGICAGWVGCQTLGALGYLGLVATFVAVSNDPAGYCAKTYGYYGYFDPYVPAVVGATTTAHPDRAEFAYCIDALAGLHKIAVLFTVNLCFIVCIGCCYACACGTGSKFAGETGDLMDDEEAGSDSNNDYY